MELAIAPFFVTPQRESVCDFSVAVYSDYQAILMQRPRLQSDVAGFMKPFSPEVRVKRGTGWRGRVGRGNWKARKRLGGEGMNEGGIKG